MDHYYAYIPDLSRYKRRQTVTVKVGNLNFGSAYPIRLQSMLTADTMDTAACVDQAIRVIKAGCELLRITAPNVKAAYNLAVIQAELRQRGYHTPLVADIHFTPRAAEIAAQLVAKIRINPGNFADKKKFQSLHYDDESYQQELDRVATKFIPLIKICKSYGTAMRIGTNHGSLSDRIMSRYGDTPLGMVESALEFLRICEAESYYNIMLSMKASNPQIMVQAYRLLVKRMDEEGLKPYPLHLGVTEAGDGLEGRLKSALGIGTLLEDGLGDTIRVSLTEEPEAEIPVAKYLAQRYQNRPSQPNLVNSEPIFLKDPYQYALQKSHKIQFVGQDNPPLVVAAWENLKTFQKTDLKALGYNYLSDIDKWESLEIAADCIYTQHYIPDFDLPYQLKLILDFETWKKYHLSNSFPYLNCKQYLRVKDRLPTLNFLALTPEDLDHQFLKELQQADNLVLVMTTAESYPLKSLRNMIFNLIRHNITLPVIFRVDYSGLDFERQQLYSSADLGALLIDGLGSGVMLVDQNADWSRQIDLTTLAFGILQAARRRITKTEYISCPSCGRTLFDLQETTARIRSQTEHLKGIKIGIMGCIVNGPGEMADADYGYVGAGKDNITLYRKQTVVKRQVPADLAVEALIDLMKADGVWVEPNSKT